MRGVRLHREGLSVEQGRVPGGRVARVPDGQRAVHLRLDFFGEAVGHQAHRPVGAQGLAVGRDDARRLLPAVLQRMEAEISKFFRLRVGIDRRHSALVMKFVGRKHSALSLQ